jgi:hypothetical protein
MTEVVKAGRRFIECALSEAQARQHLVAETTGLATATRDLADAIEGEDAEFAAELRDLAERYEAGVHAERELFLDTDAMVKRLTEISGELGL